MIRLEAYSSGTTPIVDPRDEVKLASNIRWTTYYPGGVFGTLHAYVPRRVVEWWDLQGAQRLVAREGLQVVFEGWIDNLRKAIASSGERVDITATGAWGTYALRRRLNKPWADDRTSEQQFWYDPARSGSEKYNLDRDGQIRFTPKPMDFFYASQGLVDYYAPTGQTWKRSKFSYDLVQAAHTLPKAAYYYQSGSGTYNDNPGVIDGNPATQAAAAWTTTDYWMFAFSDEQKFFVGGVRWMMAAYNTVVSTLTCEYWNGSAWTALGISDGTSVGGKTMAQDGVTTFTLPENATPVNVNGRNYLWVRFKVSVNTSAVTWNDMFFYKAMNFTMVVQNGNQNAVNTQTQQIGTAVDLNWTTPTNRFNFYVVANGPFVVPSVTSISASIPNVMMRIYNLMNYTETGAINLTEIAKDIRAAIADINATDNFIGSNTLSLEPFYTNGYERVGDILARAAGYGDASFNPWAVYFDSSEKAPTPDGKPVMVVEQMPSIASGYDYATRFQEIDTSLGDISYEENYDQIVNWMIVEYEDAYVSGMKHYITPDTDAALKDQTSIDKYGRRDLVISVNTTSSTLAAQYGKRYLAMYKNPIIRMTSPLVVSGFIDTAQNNQVPVSFVRAGKRVKITDFFGSDVVFLISNADYSDGKVTIYAGDGGILI